jgi:acyl-CoA oxidase
MKVIHHFTSGLKAFKTNNVHKQLSILRESCGSVGFHEYSGLPYLYNEHAAYVTFEGDNTVMLQQCAKLIIDGVSKNE